MEEVNGEDEESLQKDGEKKENKNERKEEIRKHGLTGKRKFIGSLLSSSFDPQNSIKLFLLLDISLCLGSGNSHFIAAK